MDNTSRGMHRHEASGIGVVACHVTYSMPCPRAPCAPNLLADQRHLSVVGRKSAAPSAACSYAMVRLVFKFNHDCLRISRDRDR